MKKKNDREGSILSNKSRKFNLDLTQVMCLRGHDLGFFLNSSTVSIRGNNRENVYLSCTGEWDCFSSIFFFPNFVIEGYFYDLVHIS